MIRRQTRNKHSSSTYKMSKQHTSIVTVKLLPEEFRTDFEGEDIGFSMTEERAEELLNILHASFETANHKELSAKSAEYKKRIADNKAFREFQEKQRAKRPTMSVETSMAFGEEIDDLKRALDEQKTQNDKLMGIIESCVLTGKIVEERGVLLAAENLQLKKDLFTWENIGRTGLDDCDKFYKEVLGLRDEVATAKALAADWEKKYNKAVVDYDVAEDKALMMRREIALAHAAEVAEAKALAADWEKKCHEAVYDQDAASEAHASEMSKLTANSLADMKDVSARLSEATETRVKIMEVAYNREMVKKDKAYREALDPLLTRVAKWEKLFHERQTDVEQLKEENEKLKVALAVKEKTTPTAVHYVELRSPVVEAPEPSPLALGTPAVPAEIPEEHSPFMTRSEQLAEESDAILQLVTALREREESIAQYLGGSTKKSPNPEEH